MWVNGCNLTNTEIKGTFWLWNVKRRKLNMTVRDRGWCFIKGKMIFGDQKIWHFGKSKRYLNNREVTSKFQVLLPQYLPKRLRNTPPCSCHYVLQEMNITKLSVRSYEKRGWFYFKQIYSIPSRSFSQIAHVCTHVHFSPVFTATQELSLSFRGKECWALSPHCISWLPLFQQWQTPFG